MKKVFSLSIAVLAIILVATSLVHQVVLDENKETKPFYVGVTYCGESVEEAKLLVESKKLQ